MKWRSRQASCLAFIDLFRVGLTFQIELADDATTIVGSSQVNPVLEKLAVIWSTAMRVQDDMKESVRDAATKLCIALKKVSDLFGMFFCHKRALLVEFGGFSSRSGIYCFLS